MYELKITHTIVLIERIVVIINGINYALECSSSFLEYSHEFVTE